MTDVLAATSVALFAWIAPCQQEAPATAPVEVQLPADWQPGTRYQVRLTKKRANYDGDKLVRSSESMTHVDVEVVERREDGYLVRWTFGETAIASNGAPVDPAAKAIADLNKGLILDLVTNETGVPTQIKNPKDALARLEESMRLIDKMLRDRGMAGELVDAVLQETRQMTTAAAFEPMALKEPQILYFPSGGAYVLGEALEYETELPSPLGGEALPAIGNIVLEELREAEGRAVIVWTQSIDPEKATAVVHETMRAMAERMGKPFPKGSELPNIEISDKARYEYDLATGIPKKVEHTRTAVSGTVRRIDTLVYEVTWPEKK